MNVRPNIHADIAWNLLRGYFPHRKVMFFGVT
jgi:hypothetical protein